MPVSPLRQYVRNFFMSLGSRPGRILRRGCTSTARNISPETGLRISGSSRFAVVALPPGPTSSVMSSRPLQPFGLARDPAVSRQRVAAEPAAYFGDGKHVTVGHAIVEKTAQITRRVAETPRSMYAAKYYVRSSLIQQRILDTSHSPPGSAMPCRKKV